MQGSSGKTLIATVLLLAVASGLALGAPGMTTFPDETLVPKRDIKGEVVLGADEEPIMITPWQRPNVPAGGLNPLFGMGLSVLLAAAVISVSLLPSKRENED